MLCCGVAICMIERITRSTHEIGLFFLTFRRQAIWSVFVMNFVSSISVAMPQYGSLWMAKSGIDVETISYFSLVSAVGWFAVLYSIALDTVKLPILHDRLGQRRSWALVSSLIALAGVVLIAQSDPKESVLALFWATILATLGGRMLFFAMRGYVIEMLRGDDIGPGNTFYALAFWVSRIVVSTVVLLSVDLVGFSNAILLGAGMIAAGACVIFFLPEPPHQKARKALAADEAANAPAQDGRGWRTWGYLTAVVMRAINQNLLPPLMALLQRKGIWLFIIFFTVEGLSDAILSNILTPFYVSKLHFSVREIYVGDLTGHAAIIAGTFLGAYVFQRFSLYGALMLIIILVSITNINFIILNELGHNPPYYLWTVAAERATLGMNVVVFAIYYTRIVDKEFAATQIALLLIPTSLIAVFIGPISGAIVSRFDYNTLFCFSIVFIIPAVVSLMAVRAKMPEIFSIDNDADTPDGVDIPNSVATVRF